MNVTDANLFRRISQDDLVKRCQVGIKQLLAGPALRICIHSGTSLGFRCGNILSACETAWHLNQLLLSPNA